LGQGAGAVAHAQAVAAGAGVLFVFQVAECQGAGAEVVFALVGTAGEGCAFEVGVAFDLDVKAIAACVDAALACCALVVVVNVLLRGVDTDGGHGAVADRWQAQADAKTCGLLFAFVAAAVLQGFDVEVAANVGGDLFSGELGAF